MLSIVLYGRNDNYGYNLHKRAAISLNCMAEIMDSADDEILFVDYNTPNDLPTFTEAIQDTLTPKAKQHLRTLRARPEVHDGFADRTHLVALEPVARNIAIRRANPKNRWVLSTNTDMIFLPRTRKQLSKTLRGLDNAVYTLPRFEIPETLWEGFDRRDPQDIFEQMRFWSRQAHLNEIVYGADSILDDAPGDFQLFPRQTFSDINGFDETMVLGWHVDSNISKRLTMALGPVRSLLDSYFGYHCDHTRMATPMHRRERIQNDLQRYVDDLSHPDLPEQSDNWGARDANIEEVRFTDAASSYASTLKRILPPTKKPYTEVKYRSESYDRHSFDPEHVIPFLLDLFAAAPRNWNVGWMGTNARMLALFAKAWSGLGFTGEILVHRKCRAIITGEIEALVRVVEPNDFLEVADTFVFDARRDRPDGISGTKPLPHPELDELSRLHSVRSVFLETVEFERDRVGDHKARRFAFVDAIHNRFEDMVTMNLAVTITPFSSRIRHGFVYIEDKGATPTGLGRNRQLTRSETAKLKDVVTLTLGAAEGSEQWKKTTKFADLILAHAEDLRALETETSDALEHLFEYIKANRLSSRIQPADGIEIVEELDDSDAPNTRSLNRVAEYDDWDFVPFLKLVERLTNQLHPHLWHTRNSTHWERTQLVLGLDRTKKSGKAVHALVTPYTPDQLLGVLADMVSTIDVLPLERNATTSSLGVLTDHQTIDAEQFKLLGEEDTIVSLKSASYDLIVLPHRAATAYGPRVFVRLLAQAARLLKPDGVAVIVGEVHAGGPSSAATHEWGMPTSTAFWNGVGDTLGLELTSPFDGRVTASTIDRAWEDASGPLKRELYFGRRDALDNVYLPATFFVSKRVGATTAKPDLSTLYALAIGQETLPEIPSVDASAEKPLSGSIPAKVEQTPDWLAAAAAMADAPDEASRAGRTPTVWLRTRALKALQAFDHHKPGFRVLAIVHSVDPLIELLVTQGAHVTVFDPTYTRNDPAWQWLCGPESHEHTIDSVAELSDAAPESFDLVLGAPLALQRRGTGPMANTVSNAARLLKTGGHLILPYAAPIDGDAADPTGLTTAFWELAELATGLKVDGDTAHAKHAVGTPEQDATIVRDRAGALFVPTLAVAVKTGAGAAKLGSSFEGSSFAGERLPYLHLADTDAITREPDGVHVTQYSGHAAFGPYEKPVPGRFTLRVELADFLPYPRRKFGVRRPNLLAADAIAGGKVFGRKIVPMVRSADKRAIEVRFTIKPEDARGLMEFRVWSDGYCSYVIKSVMVTSR
ncbi:MAG: hypothetical protein Rhirs2KO_19020 [Rhizobiaceae bacterium]